jgi:hypothetical protein
MTIGPVQLLVLGFGQADFQGRFGWSWSACGTLTWFE